MKTNSGVWLSLLTCFFLISCKDSPKESPVNTPQQATVEEQHTHSEHQEEIQLNQGAKWTVDPNMMNYLRLMEQDISTFSASAPDSYKVLSGKLQKNVDLLTSKCTMSGQAHDELHKWLLPYIDLVDQLGKAGNEKEAADMYARLKDSFQTFNRYFQ